MHLNDSFWKKIVEFIAVKTAFVFLVNAILVHMYKVISCNTLLKLICYLPPPQILFFCTELNTTSVKQTLTDHTASICCVLARYVMSLKY